MARRRNHLLIASATLLSACVIPAAATASLPRVIVAHVMPTYGAPTTARTAATTFDIVLKTRDASLRSYVAQLSDPQSPNYRHFLTTDQFARRFGASAHAVDAVRDYLTKNGLKVTHVNKADTIIQVSGSTSAIAHAFSATLLTYRYQGITNLALSSSASLPPSVGKFVKTVVGLNGITSLHTHLAYPQSTTRVSAPSTCSAAGVSDSSSNTVGSNGYNLTQQGRLYGLTAQWAAGNYGTGEKIALYELSGYSSGDVAAYQSCYGLTNSIQAINVDGGPQSADNSGSNPKLEAVLDIEEAAGLAPGAGIQVYQSTQTIGSAPLDTYAQIADDNTSQIVSTSWGACEYDTSTQPFAEQLVFQQMAVQGQTVFSAAGDNGSSDCVGDAQISLPSGVNLTYPDSVLAVDDPSSQPLVTAVGGLFVPNITQIPTVWDVPCSGPGDPNHLSPYACPTAGGRDPQGGGGGLSAVWSRPTWQQAAATNLSPTPTMRMLPDLSVMADPQSGFTDYYDGSWDRMGGTSIGSPLMAALVAVAANACGVTNFGSINPTLYSMPSNSFVDIGAVTPSSNAVAYGQTSYQSGAGYDMASGLGTPAATPSFITNLCPSGPQANHSLASVASSSVLTTSLGTTLSVTARDRTGATVAGATVGINFVSTAASPLIVNGLTDPAQPLVAITNSSGVATFTLSSTTPGTATITALIGAQVIGSPLTVVFTAPPITLHAPTAPSITRLTGLVGSLSVVLRAPSSNGGSPVTHYQYSLNGRAWVTVGTALSFTITRLTSRVRYSLRVRAQNGVGYSPASAAKVGTTR